MRSVTETAEALREALLKLPDEDRAQLAAELLASLDGPPDDEVEEAWNAEIERRIGEVESDSVKLVEWSDVRARLEHRLRKR
jgi:putative addiction module component (TIGR02574 family)